MHIFYLLRAGSTAKLREFLTANSSALEAKNPQGLTPLILASYLGRLDLVQVLVEQGAEVNGRDGLGNTAMMGAAFKGHLGLVKYLLAAGADLEAVNDAGLNTMSYALNFNQPDVLEFLLQYEVA